MSIKVSLNLEIGRERTRITTIHLFFGRVKTHGCEKFTSLFGIICYVGIVFNSTLYDG